MHYCVRMAELEPWQYAFVAAARTNASVHHCALSAAAESGEPLDSILARLMLWLPAMFSMGILAPET